jgi:tRNA A-37 threonylcarbamoyl transferase component Bud32/Tol biopolymer transport system component
MTLASGARLGPYEILAPLGAGGMGEVYRAKDTKLGRDVAVKVLPEEFFEDEDRRIRFEREARTLASLNHPGIAAIHSFEEGEGRHILVMELLEGETLRSALGGAKLSTRKAIDFARQMAQGLAAAHEKGIVHRDLKPENIFVTKDGRVKILDFGLAKLAHPDESADVTNLPTATQGTQPGVVMGTLDYMSPEQVKGLPADSRSDIFSFGAVLHEMLTGSRAFKRSSAAETISAILKEDPPDISATNQNVPAGLERLVSHCLEKNPEQRFHSAHDLAFDLESLSGSSAIGAAPSSVATRRGKARGGTIVLGALALVAATALGFFARGFRGSAAPPSFQRLTFRRGLVMSARFAPDGQTVVYGAAWEGAPFELFTTRSESQESRALGVGADILSVSGTGELAISLGRRFTRGWENTGTLARVPLEGGAPREVLENVQEADWAPDGKNLLVVREVAGRSRLEYPVGKVLYEANGWISLARLSPRGDRIAFIDHPQQGDNVGSLCVVDLAGKKTTYSGKKMTEGATGIAWSPDGSEVWGSGGGTLFAMSRPDEARVLACLPGGVWILDVSRTGKALIAQTSIRREIAGLTPGETKERNLSWFDWSFPGGLSSDGRTILFEESSRQTEAGYPVYLRKTDGSPAVQLGEGAAVALSPDGRWALSILRPFAKTQLVLLPTGAGQPKTLPADAIHYARWGAFLPDGKRLVVAGSEEGHGARLYVRDLDGGPARPVTPEGIQIRFNGGALSPDGKLVAAVGPEERVILYPIEGGEPRPAPGVAPGELPVRWSTATSLFVVSRPGEMPSRIFRVDLATGRREPWKQLTTLDPAGVFSIDPIMMTPDGKAHVYSYRRLLSDLYLVEGLR